MMPQFFACLTSHPLYIPSSFAVETLQLVRNLLRVDWQISPPNSSAIPLIDVDGEKIKPKTKAMKFSAALRDGNARHKKFSSLKVSIKSSTCITDQQISFHVGLYKMQKFSNNKEHPAAASVGRQSCKENKGDTCVLAHGIFANIHARQRTYLPYRSVAKSTPFCAEYDLETT